MSVTIRFSAQFRERFGPAREITSGTPDGTLRDSVIVMSGTGRIEGNPEGLPPR